MKCRLQLNRIMASIVGLFAFLSVPSVAGRLELGGVTLDFDVPLKISAYEKVPVKCKLSGAGDVIVQVVATENPAYDRYFDTAIPHKVAFRFEYLSESDGDATFRITNIGDTIWKAGGYGGSSPADFSAGYADLHSETAPGESFIKTYPVSRMHPENSSPETLRFVLVINRKDSRNLPEGQAKVELVVPDCKPGRVETKERIFEAIPLHDTFDEFGQTFIRRTLEAGKPLKATLKVLTPPWADRLVVRLIKNGEIKIASMPIKVSQDSLRLRGKSNKRWTLDGKPIFIMNQVPVGEIPKLRERLGGANVVLGCGRQMQPNTDWLRAARENGFKITPATLAYIRLQNIGKDTGWKLMEGAPEKLGLQRVDALDPNFPKAMADVVDKMFENAGDLLYRTADGKVPMALSSEQSYGFPFSDIFPTRWGGGTPEDVAAFRVWLRGKYDTIDKLNTKWKTSYKSFDEIDPSPICSLSAIQYPDPWKEWGPAIEDFDIFRSKIHGEFWARTVTEIKKRHPEVICGMHLYEDYASETEPIYIGISKWGVKDYAGKGVNWVARRIAALPDDMKCFDFIMCWNTGPADAVEKNLGFWGERGKDVVIFVRGYPKVIFGGDLELRGAAPLNTGVKGLTLPQTVSFFTTLKATYEAGGIAGILNDSQISRMSEVQRREIAIFNKEVARAAKSGSPGN